VSVLVLEGLSKHFGGLAAVSGCSLSVAAGEVHALIGPNGAGKTTLINLISGALQPTQGRIYLDGRDITHLPQHQRVRLGLARTFQVTNLFNRYTVLENLELAVQARSGSSFSFWRPVSRERQLTHEAEQLSALVGLSGRNHTRVSQLSHGEQRQLEVGLALAGRPRLLLLDEPMAGMGLEESQRMVELIARLAEGYSLTILLVEHDMNAVFQLAQRISVLVYGQVIASGRPEEIRANPEVHRAYLGDEQLGRQR